MANLIQIKRSLNSASPTSLANGELAYTANGDVLFIGSNGVTVAIGGARTPGVLTANQALVANSTGFIDTVKAANAIITSLSANGSYGTAGQVLVSNGTNIYWGTGTSGANTQVQFNDSGVANGSAGFTFTKTSNTLAVSNTVTAAYVLSSTQVNSALISVGALFTANSTLVNAAAINVTNQVNAATLYATTSANVGALVRANTTAYMVGANSTVNTVITATSITQANTTATPFVANASGVYTTGTANAAVLSVGSSFIANATQITIASAVGLSANGTLGSANQVLRTSGTTVYWADDLGDIQSVVAGNGLTGGGTTGDITLNVGAANGITVAADTVGVLAGPTLTVNSTGVHVNSTLSIQDLTLSGNLVVSGTLTTLETTNLIVEDPLIALAKDQANSATFTDGLDIGFFGSYGNTTQKVYTGLFRDQSDSGTYKLFAGQIPDPTTTVDTANVNFSLATLQSYLKSSALLSNSSVTNITANSTVSVAITANTLSAGSLTLTTPLAATSGGTGLNTYTSGDILVANTGNTLSKLSLGIDGYVLQSNGTALVYNTLDGGTF